MLILWVASVLRNNSGFFLASALPLSPKPGSLWPYANAGGAAFHVISCYCTGDCTKSASCEVKTEPLPVYFVLPPVRPGGWAEMPSDSCLFFGFFVALPPAAGGTAMPWVHQPLIFFETRNEKIVCSSNLQAWAWTEVKPCPPSTLQQDKSPLTCPHFKYPQNEQNEHLETVVTGILCDISIASYKKK